MATLIGTTSPAQGTIIAPNGAQIGALESVDLAGDLAGTGTDGRSLWPPLSALLAVETEQLEPGHLGRVLGLISA
jgi:hypothetical protein